jgi:hypothetical protein
LPYWHSFGNINADRYQIAFYCSDAHTEFWIKAILFLIGPDQSNNNRNAKSSSFQTGAETIFLHTAKQTNNKL